MSQSHKPALIGIGPLAGLGAFCFWGISGAYFHAVGFAGAMEILSHRIVWSVVLTLVLIFALGRKASLLQLLGSARTIGVLCMTGLLIAGNWLIYIWSVNHGHAIEASLGYYIMPLIMLVLGRIFLKETLNRVQVLSVIIVSLGVLNLLAFFGTVPWIALGLAFLFGFYGLLRKMVPADPIAGLFVECLALLPIALIYLGWLESRDELVFLQTSTANQAMLIGLGAMTTIPLVLFAFAARNMKFGALGLMQYINPTLQLCVAVLLFGEPFTQAHLITYIFVWCGLALFTWDNLRTSRAARANS
ncbi:permease [Thalassospira profundimaris]|uniref:Permease n=1 Tax=Thalassospira profundimaris TaxID=502049 RepID=A0A367WQ04_9PROT|nr:EamA family transporter RarD [Thalassospira profundimaris]RCK43458.1 permease [Thalassospira profundimaris]